jgi:hypothetical protein
MRADRGFPMMMTVLAAVFLAGTCALLVAGYISATVEP